MNTIINFKTIKYRFDWQKLKDYGLTVLFIVRTKGNIYRKKPDQTCYRPEFFFEPHFSYFTTGILIR
jgi:hypothetical protein